MVFRVREFRFSGQKIMFPYIVSDLVKGHAESILRIPLLRNIIDDPKELNDISPLILDGLSSGPSAEPGAVFSVIDNFNTEGKAIIKCI